MRTIIVTAMLAASALAQGATLETEGTAQPFLPEAILAPSQELQATVHPLVPTVLFGCRKCEGQLGTDLYITVKRGAAWTEKNRASLSTPGNESMPSFSSDGYWLYYVVDRKGGFGGTDLMRSNFRPHRGIFSPPELLQGTINSAGDEGGAAANAHGDTTIFASRGRKGAKGWDLWQSRRVAGKMSEAVPLASINTGDDEFDPAILANDAGLVFARSGKIDDEPSTLWFAPKQGDGFGEPVKLGAAINAPGSSVRGPQQDWTDPAYLLFTRDGDVVRIRYRIAP